MFLRKLKDTNGFGQVNENWGISDTFGLGHAQSGTLPNKAFKGHSKLESFEVILDKSMK